MNKILKWTLISIGIGLIACLGFVFYSMWGFVDTFEPTYSKQDLIDNYNLKSKEIDELVVFIKSIIPKDKDIDIEFDDDNTLAIFHVTINGQTNSNWNIKTNSTIVDSLLRKSGLTQMFLTDLKTKLDNAKCISVQTGEPMTIGFQRSGMGQYFYKVFNQNLNDSLIKQYNDSCQYIFYKDNIVFEYGGGAIGPQCFDK